jgi:hypothetical protein
LPFDIQGDDDILSQLSSQYSSSAKSSDAHSVKPTIRNQMIHINQQQMAENMFCLEFDLTEIPMDNEVGRRFRKIDQSFIESTVRFQISGACHGQNIFENEVTIDYAVTGKKIIKSL